MVIQRDFYLNSIRKVFEVFPICGLLGPRQCGKTTLALEYAKEYGKVTLFDLEDPSHMAKLQSPTLVLEGLEGLLIIDEIQRAPELFPYLRVLVDRNPKIKILILGSSSPTLLETSAETLAGRVYYLELTPFGLMETPDMQRLWNLGGFPRSFLSDTEEKSLLWRKGYIQTFLERDIKTLGFDISSNTMRKLWYMVAHYHGNLVNYTDLGRSLNVSDTSIKRYLEILESTFMIRLLKPWHENIGKRQVKAPKLYIRDSGLLHTLLGVNSENLPLHPKSGASWEGFALESLIQALDVQKEDCYFWRVHTGAELDLLVYKEGQKQGFEFKYTDRPKMTPSLKSAATVLGLDKVWIIVPKGIPYAITDQVNVSGLKEFIEKTKPR